MAVALRMFLRSSTAAGTFRAEIGPASARKSTRMERIMLPNDVTEKERWYFSFFMCYPKGAGTGELREGATGRFSPIRLALGDSSSTKQNGGM